MLSENDIRATIEMLEDAIDSRILVEPPLAWALTADVLRWVLEDNSKAAASVESRIEDAREQLGIHPQGL